MLGSLRSLANPGDVVDFADQIAAIAARIPKHIDHLETEEATKNALVMPFLAALGYNVFDPFEVVPEFSADVGTKKGEKVDYAILKDGVPIMLVECKKAASTLDGQPPSQLFRYFACTEARIGVLTDGVVYRFYTDLEKPNTMDDRPFLEINLLAYTEAAVRELKRFCKAHFDLDQALEAAGELKYTRAIKNILARDMHTPSEALVKYYVSEVYQGRFTAPVREQFTDITRRAMQQFFTDLINERLKTALGTSSPSGRAEEEAADGDEDEKAQGGIVTTQEEIDATLVVKAILRDVVDVSRVAMRDRKSYCGILLDDNNRKPICRLHFNTAQKYLGLFDEQRKERREPIDSLDDIYIHAEDIRATVRRYLAAEPVKATAPIGAPVS